METVAELIVSFKNIKRGTSLSKRDKNILKEGLNKLIDIMSYIDDRIFDNEQRMLESQLCLDALIRPIFGLLLANNLSVTDKSELIKFRQKIIKLVSRYDNTYMELSFEDETYYYLYSKYLTHQNKLLHEMNKKVNEIELAKISRDKFLEDKNKDIKLAKKQLKLKKKNEMTLKKSLC